MLETLNSSFYKECEDIKTQARTLGDKVETVNIKSGDFISNDWIGLHYLKHTTNHYSHKYPHLFIKPNLHT